MTHSRGVARRAYKAPITSEQFREASKWHRRAENQAYTPPLRPSEFIRRGTPEWDIREYQRERQGYQCICYGPVPSPETEGETDQRWHMHPEAISALRATQ